MNDNTSFNTLPIKNLKNYNFFVDEYQRGYKWNAQQVYDLLDDIKNFDMQKDKFYCLQPLVVKQRSDEKIKRCFEKNISQNIYEVIDGQQRLTTIYIILNSLEKEPPFTIKYQTREASAEFLGNINKILFEYSIDDISIRNDTIQRFVEKVNEQWKSFSEKNKDCDNVDNYHFFTAYLTINNWLVRNQEKQKKFMNTLKNNTHFIWYEDTRHENSKEVFRNINNGKTELTNAELIKALFINSIEEPNKEIEELKKNELADVWDQMEKKLNDDSFWYFISNETDETKYPTRIDFLFELIVGNKENKYDALHSYRQYAAKAKEKDKTDFIEEDWEEVKTLYHQLVEWFEDREMYHLIGFIIYSKLKLKPVKYIKEKYEKSKTKKDFKEELNKIIKDEINHEDKEGNLKYDFETLNYHEHDEQIFKLLLLHNIETYQKSEAAFRFPFDKFKNNNKTWSLEHIHAQNAEDFTTKDEYIAWLKDLIGLLDNWVSHDEREEMKEEINELIEELNKAHIDLEIKKETLLNLKSKTDDFFQANHISNLALLDSNTNSSLGNNNFKEKRKQILKIDQDEWVDNKGEKVKAFVPVCTKNAFLKYYSSEINQMEYWGFQDRRNYLNNIKETLTPYFEQKGNDHDQ